MDFSTPLISPVVECIGDSYAIVARQIGYIKNLERNFEKLKEEARSLIDEKKDKEDEINRDGNNIPTHQCQSWLYKVNEIQNQVNSIEEEYSKGDKRCLSRWCLNLSSSWKLGRRIVLKTNVILDLSEKAKSARVVVDVGYIKDLERNFEQLNEKATTLYSKKEDMELEINRDRICKRPKSECQDWLKRVDGVHNKVDTIKEEYSQEAERCQTRWCPDIQSHWKLGQRIVEITNQISKLTEESTKFEGVIVVDTLPPIVETKSVHAIIEEGTSAKRTLQKILNSVRDPRKYKIGISGMGGVGKTTVMKHLNNLPEIAEMFEIVIWVDVSQDYSTSNLQIQILERLRLKGLSEGVNVQRAASRLLQELTNRKFLLLMDDLWKAVDLHDIGVPCPNQKGCKIVFTTRYHDVCRKMEINEEIKVETLSEKEAWNIFREKVGEVADSQIIGRLARSVVHECGGLPLAITVIGTSLSMEDNAYIWQNAVQELSSPDTSDTSLSMEDDMEEQVFRRLKFSFDRLENDDVKNCFLYAALYPEDWDIDIFELIEYWRAEGLIHSELTLASVRNKGHAMVKRLIDASLLLKSDESNVCVKMHDVIRDLALRITARMESGCRFLVRAKKMIEEPPKNEDWENVNRMSLMGNKIGSLPERPNCPVLLTLLLQINRKLTTIPESFFDQMPALRVLDLSGTAIKSLPRSICHLVNLRGLYLKYCGSLKTLPPEIGKLTNMEVLDARGTCINSLPTEIGQLSGLKVLHVTFSMERDKKVSGGIISKLSQLEQLIIDLGFSDWDFSRYKDTCAEVVMEEVSFLEGLMSLEFGFPKMEYLEFFLQRSHPWKNELITSFNIIVGQYQLPNIMAKFFSHFAEEERMNRMLTFCGYDSITNAIVEVLRHSDSFLLLGHKSVHSLCEFDMQNMRGLIWCSINECDAMGIIVDGNQLVQAALPKLDYLCISHMPNLRSIWAGSFPLGSLYCLTTLQLFECGKLKNIFSREIIEQLSNLENLIVDSCSALEEVISDEEIGVESDCVLPKLKVLFLHNLPSLVRILKLGRQLLNCSSLQTIWAAKCPNLKRLPISIGKAPKLSWIVCRTEWWNELEWDDNDVKLQLEPLIVPSFL